MPIFVTSAGLVWRDSVSPTTLNSDRSSERWCLLNDPSTNTLSASNCQSGWVSSNRHCQKAILEMISDYLLDIAGAVLFYRSDLETEFSDCGFRLLRVWALLTTLLGRFLSTLCSFWCQMLFTQIWNAFNVAFLPVLLFEYLGMTSTTGIPGSSNCLQTLVSISQYINL